MRSLFVRLWVAFLLVVALTFAASMGGIYLMAVERAAGLNSNVFPQAIAKSAQQVLSARGPDGIAGWTISQNHERPELQIYFVDPGGREMLNRNVRGQPLPGSAGMLAPVVRAPDGTAYRMLVRRTSNLVFDFWDVFFRPWMVLGLTLMISALGSAWLAWEMSRPVRRLRAGVRAVAAGDLETDIGGRLARRRDELGGLARDFGQMTKDLRAHIAAREELLRDVSHELRSPLARLRLAADLACSGRGDRKRLFDRIEREVERIDAMIGQILHFSRIGASRPLAHDEVELAQLLEEIVEDAQIEADDRGIAIRLVTDDPGHVRGDRSKFRSAIENVLRNALRHSPQGSEVAVRLERASDAIRIEVRDQGPGLQTADADWIFEPFQRGDGSEGAGLGLAITRRIMELHGGHTCAANVADGGLCVELRLPHSV
ncbi:MAG TPA: ATP-binding protein [Sphingomicrobium sp.]|nr:ATP-binding protein [Sphingomicrobium sp.]